MNFDAVSEYNLMENEFRHTKQSLEYLTLYSRRLEKITSQYVDVKQSLFNIPARDFIVEGEVVAVDSKRGKYLPFQELMHRRRKYRS